MSEQVACQFDNSLFLVSKDELSKLYVTKDYKNYKQIKYIFMWHI